MIKLLHAGFDTLDVAFAGALPEDALDHLEQARQDAQESQEPSLITLGPGKVDMHVSGHGMRGGYAYLMDTGPLGAKWMVKRNADTRQWNLFASPRATTLLAHGFEDTRDLLRDQLEAMGARVTDHAVNRVDFAMDFRTQGFELHQDQFVAHSHTKVSPHWGKRETARDRNQLAAVVRGRRLESVTIGKQPGRQIIVYDKRREAIERQKPFWFATWGVDRDDPTLEVWRVEVRAGKKELKERYCLRSFEDIADGVGDVILNALKSIRYVADGQRNRNVSRQSLHSLWVAAQRAAIGRLEGFCAGLTPGQVKASCRQQKVSLLNQLLLGNAIALGVLQGLSDEAIEAEASRLAGEAISATLAENRQRIPRKILQSRSRNLFYLND